MAVIEYARNVLGMKSANTEENDPQGSENVVIFMPEIDKFFMGGTMRLGSKTTTIKDPKSLASKVYYNSMKATERHRHRYEVNPDYVERLEESGLVFSG